MGLSVARADQPARIVPEIVRVSLWAVFGLWLARRLGRLLLLILRSPTAMVTITVAVLATLGWQLVHPALPLGVAGGLLAGLVVWRVRWPDSFTRHVRCRVRGWVRGCWIYRVRWTAAMDTAGLLVARHGTDYVPPLLAVRSTGSVDRVTVQMLRRPNHRRLRRRWRTGSPRRSGRPTAGSAPSPAAGTCCSCGYSSATPSKTSSPRSRRTRTASPPASRSR